MPIYEPLFADGSFGYRPNRSAKNAILKVKEYAEQGYTYAVVLDLSPLLENVYLNEFDQEFRKRGVPCIRYADAIVLLAQIINSLALQWEGTEMASGGKSLCKVCTVILRSFT